MTSADAAEAGRDTPRAATFLAGRFTGRVALVTGAGGAFGQAIATRFAAEGGTVAMLDLNADAVQAAAADIRERGGAATAYPVDLVDPDAVTRTVEQVLADHGRLDAAVNNAGIGGDMAPLADYPVATWQRVIDTNLSSVFYCLRAELPHMVAAGGGAIVNTASIMGSVAAPMIGAYVAAKHGVVGLSQAAALEYGPSGIRVNAVGPSFSRVGFAAATIDDDQWTVLKAAHPLGRLGTSEDVAGLVAYLLSDDAAFVTGQLYLVDGGYTAQ
jgi:NAD(P)-dependent dehydrogenase (short-subunit alcohol dehydrogenase family)